MEVKEKITGRRRFLKGGLYAVAAAVLAPVVYGFFDFFTYIRRDPRAPAIIEKSHLGAGRYEFVCGGRPAVLFRENGQVAAMSLECTHLGCIVKWSEKNKRYECPCHGGTFNESGEVLSDPPRLPLKRLKVEERDGNYIVGGE